MVKQKKTYLFYLGHPAHYHNISVVIREMTTENCNVILVARAKDVLFKLLENLPYTIIFLPPKKGKNKFWLVIEVLKRQFILVKLCIKHKPKMLIGTDIVITHIGKLFKIPSVILNEDDAKEVPLLAKFGFKYATAVFSPNCCDISPYHHKKIGYNGYHELAYLHPNYFTPDKTKILNLLEKGENYFILRFAELTAHHDKGKKGINLLIAKKLIDKLAPFGQVFITSERKLETELEPYRIKIHPKNMHHALYFAKMYIGDSQTMAAEAAVLGTPSVRFNDFVGKLGYLEELEHQYQLTFGILTKKSETLFTKVDELLQMPNLAEEFRKRKEKMLHSTQDVMLLWKNYFMNTEN